MKKKSMSNVARKHSKGSAQIPTALFNKNYLKRAWADRSDLSDYERRGFAQFIYITLCGHIETLLSQLIEARLFSIRRMVDDLQGKPFIIQVNNEQKAYSNQPVMNSLEQLFDTVDQEIGRGSFENLKGIFSKMFVRSMVETLGTELSSDVEALFRLRNLFAHGRRLVMEFEGSPPNMKGNMDENPLRLPAQRLQNAGIIKSLGFTQWDYHELQARFYSDDAILYFYDKVLELERVLTKASREFEPDALMFHIQPLPDLHSGS